MPNAKTHMLCWRPHTADAMLVPWPDRLHASRGYYAVLACMAEVQRANFEKRKALVFIEAMHAIIRDGVDPAAVHRALWPLDEYRAGLSPDVPAPGSIAGHRSAPAGVGAVR